MNNVIYTCELLHKTFLQDLTEQPIFLTLPRSSSCVSMTMVKVLCSQTIRQKSSIVSSSGPNETFIESVLICLSDMYLTMM